MIKLIPVNIEILVKLLISVLLGGAVGLEREVVGKPAGFRTNVLICFGSTLFTMLSYMMCQNFQVFGPSDPTRIAAQIVTGIGFIGAGTVLRSQGSIQGLTSAATIWAVAAIGMAVGVGSLYLAILAAIFIVVVLIVFSRLENFLSKREETESK